MCCAALRRRRDGDSTRHQRPSRTAAAAAAWWSWRRALGAALDVTQACAAAVRLVTQRSGTVQLAWPCSRLASSRTRLAATHGTRRRRRARCGAAPEENGLRFPLAFPGQGQRREWQKASCPQGRVRVRNWRGNAARATQPWCRRGAARGSSACLGSDLCGARAARNAARAALAGPPQRLGRGAASALLYDVRSSGAPATSTRLQRRYACFVRARAHLLTWRRHALLGTPQRIKQRGRHATARSRRFTCGAS